MLLSYFPLLLTSDISIHNYYKLEIHVDALSLTELYTLFRFYQFSSSVLLFALGSHSGYHITFSLYVSLFFSSLWFLRLFLSLMILMFSKYQSDFFFFSRMSLNLDFFNVFLMVRQKSWVLGKKTAEL